MVKYSLIVVALFGTSVSTQLIGMEEKKTTNANLSVGYSWNCDTYTGDVTCEFPIEASSCGDHLGKNLFDVLPMNEEYQEKMRTRFSAAVHSDSKKIIHYRCGHKKYLVRVYPLQQSERGHQILMINIRERANKKK